MYHILFEIMWQYMLHMFILKLGKLILLGVLTFQSDEILFLPSSFTDMIYFPFPPTEKSFFYLIDRYEENNVW